MKTVVFIRKKREEANSIEEIFGLLAPYLGDNVELKELPCSGASITAILKNLIYAFRNRGDINHISGEIHYIALSLGKNTLLTIHDVGSILKGNAISRFIKKLLWFDIPCKIVNRISTISNHSQKELLEIVPSIRGKVSVIYNPLNPSLQQKNVLHEANSKLQVLHLGTKQNKNLELVLNALKHYNCDLHILGKMTSAQIELANKNNISYHNAYNIPFSRVIELYQKADIISFPSQYEGFGMPIIEANAMGKPIIAGDIPVLHEIGADAAYFINPNSIHEYIEAIIKLSSNQELKQKLCIAGAHNVKRFLPQRIAAQYRKIYKELNK